MSTAAQTPRDFTYIKPRKRRLSEYEAVSCYTQPDPNVFDRQGWYLLTPEGRTAWRPESTRLQHPHWFDFRDPSGLWQRNYVKLQAEQERSIERSVEDAALAGIFGEFDPVWLNEIHWLFIIGRGHFLSTDSSARFHVHNERRFPTRLATRCALRQSIESGMRKRQCCTLWRSREVSKASKTMRVSNTG